jgi:pimeloyl-ACP methyl ester carboxylesterase
LIYGANTEVTNHTLLLPDGRKLGYAEYGIADGEVVLFFHGAPGSRRSIFTYMAKAAAQYGIRLIVPERPGYGLSDPMKERSVHDWITDVLMLINALGISRFKVIGFSMGSLYALACAHAMPTQVNRVAIVGGLAPMNTPSVTIGMTETLRSLFELACSDPQQLRAAMAPLGGSAATMRAVMATLMPTADQTLLTAYSQEFEGDFSESLRNGIEAISCDFVLASSAWPFTLSEIHAEVDLWVGTEDGNTPPAMSRYLASMLPHNQLFELSDVGHLCLYTHWNNILDRLIVNF